MNLYSIKVALRDISPMIWRRLRVPDCTSIADLHHLIQIAMNWDDDHLHCFHIYGKDYGIAYAGGISFSDGPRTVCLEDFSFDVGDRFTYTYNFTDPWLSDIRIESIQPVAATKSANITPYCLDGQGKRGDKLYHHIDERCALWDVLVAIFQGDEHTTTIGDIQRLIERYESIRFNRSSINTQFAQFT